MLWKCVVGCGCWWEVRPAMGFGELQRHGEAWQWLWEAKSKCGMLGRTLRCGGMLLNRQSLRWFAL